MFVSAVCIDNADTFEDQVFAGAEVDPALVARLIRSLDGYTHTLVTLKANEDAHMAVGGDAGRGLIVYQTVDNMSFHTLVSGSAGDQEMVRLVAGGQPGEYPARLVVDVDTAVTAAVRYATDGTLADGLTWEAS